MNEIEIKINFTKGTLATKGIALITGDYASTKLKFEFDREDGRKVFEMKSPSNELVYADEIINNEILLTSIDELGHNKSLFNEEGSYIFEVSLYEGDTKLTSTKGTLQVKQEQVVIDGEIVEPYLPVFDELMQDLNTAIEKADNIDVEAEKVEHTTTITITRKDGTSYDVQVLDGEKGEKGDKGEAGAIKILIVNELPSVGAEDTIYLVPLENPDVSGNNYAEYIYINGQWELLGKIGVQVDLSDYYTKTETNTLLDNKVGFTDYATSSKGGTIKISNWFATGINANGQLFASAITYQEYQELGNNTFIAKGTLENVITGKDLTTKSYVDGLVGDIASVIDSINGEVI